MNNVPHVGHEWLMKSAWFQSGADAILDNPVIGEKKQGDAIDEAIVLGHAMLSEAGYFKTDVHMSALRKKLGDDPASPRYVHTVRGVGFRFAPPAELAE